MLKNADHNAWLFWKHKKQNVPKMNKLKTLEFQDYLKVLKKKILL